jgi:hypothetical protein
MNLGWDIVLPLLFSLYYIVWATDGVVKSNKQKGMIKDASALCISTVTNSVCDKRLQCSSHILHCVVLSPIELGTCILECLLPIHASTVFPSYKYSPISNIISKPTYVARITNDLAPCLVLSALQPSNQHSSSMFSYDTRDLDLCFSTAGPT